GQIRKLDGEVKEFRRVEKAKRAEAQADDLARYLVAAWKYNAQGFPKSSLDQIAKEEKLDEAILFRCNKFVKNAPAGFEMMRKMSAAKKDVVVAAQTVQKQVKATIAQKGKLDKMKQDLLSKLFYADDSVFQLSDSKLRAL